MEKDKKYILVGNYEAVKFEIDPMDLIVDQKDLVGVRGDSYPLGSLLKNGVEIETSCRYESFYLKDFEKVKGKIYNLKDVNEAINNFGREMKPVLRMS